MYIINHPSIAHDVDRKAYKALENLRRLREYHLQLHRLARIKELLARVVAERHPNIDHKLLTDAVIIGQNQLDTGCIFDQAMSVAEAHIQSAHYNHESLGSEAADVNTVQGYRVGEPHPTAETK